MNESNIEIVRHFYDSLNAGRYGELFDRFAPGLQWRGTDAYPHSNGRHPDPDPEPVADAVFQRIADDWDDYCVTVDRYVGDAEDVVALGSYSGVYRPTGKRMRVPVAHAWTMRDGQVVAFGQYLDTAAVQRAMVWSWAYPMKWPSLAGAGGVEPPGAPR